MLIYFARLGPTLTKKSLNPFAMSFLCVTVFPFEINLSGRGELCCPFLIIVFSIFHVPFVLIFLYLKVCYNTFFPLFLRIVVSLFVYTLYFSSALFVLHCRNFLYKLFSFLHAFRSPDVNHGFILLPFASENIFLTGQCLSYRLTNVFMKLSYAILTSVEPMTSSQFCSSSSFFSASLQFLSVCLMRVYF